MRTFIALEVDDVIRERLARFIEGVRGFAPDARWVQPESLHVTLKFIGEKPPEVVEKIKDQLAATRMAGFGIGFRGYGFFPAPKAARVFWIGIESGPQISALAEAVDEATFPLGIPQEAHPFSPHLTLARGTLARGTLARGTLARGTLPRGGGGSGSPHQRRDDRPNSQFQRLQEKLGALPPPEFGTMTAREFFLYESQLLRGGARYTKIWRYELV